MGTIAGMRNELNAKRAAAVQKYMATQFGPPITYEVLVHDAPTPGISGVFAGNAYRGQGSGYRGGISAGGVCTIRSSGSTCQTPNPAAAPQSRNEISSSPRSPMP